MVLFCGIFLVVGAIFTAAGITMALTDSGFMERAEEITAEITIISSYRDTDEIGRASCRERVSASV